MEWDTAVDYIKLCLKNTCHYIFDRNLNVNYPITIIFGTLIAQTIGHQKWFHFSASPI